MTMDNIDPWKAAAVRLQQAEEHRDERLRAQARIAQEVGTAEAEVAAARRHFDRLKATARVGIATDAANAR